MTADMDTLAGIASGVKNARRPTVYLTNAASRRPPHRGPGRVLTIMARPRPQYGEAGEGKVPMLIPDWPLVRDAKAGRLSMEDYRAHYTMWLDSVSPQLGPGELTAALTEGGSRPVEDGDTLVCACSRAAAAEGRCHRVWAAEVLAEIGWRVVLDGRPLEDR